MATTRLTIVSTAAIPTVDEHSALYLPIWAITPAHKGRKIRTDGQVLAYDPTSSHLLLASSPNPLKPSDPAGTQLVNASIALMGQSPAAADLSHVYGSLYSSLPQTPVAATRPFTHRLTLARGEWVSLVGYLEGDLPKRVQAIESTPSYTAPFPIALEAIHIAARPCPPPVSAIYPGS